MAIKWGPWEGTSRRLRVGIEIIWTESDGSGPVTNTSAGAQALVKYYVDADGSWSDSQTLTWSGALDGSLTKVNYQNNSSEMWLSRVKDYFYSSSSYGTSPGTWTFKASLSGAGNGSITPSVSVTANIPARPYAAPVAPVSVTATRLSDESMKVSWVNQATAGKPYSNLDVQIDGAANNVWNDVVATLAGTATSYTDSGHTGPNEKFQYRLIARNSVGSATSLASGVVFGTPNAPTALTRTGNNGANQDLTWANSPNYPEYRTYIYRVVNGVEESTPAADLANGVTSWTDTVPGMPENAANRYKYRARHSTTASDPVLTSAYSADTTETSGTVSPPAAPTGLSPSGIIINPASSRTFAWTHNPTDASAQSAYEFQWRVAGSLSWDSTGKVTSTTSSHLVAANAFPNDSTIEWQVRTWGVSPGLAGAWSSTASFTTSSDPTAVRQNLRPLCVNTDDGGVDTLPRGSLPPVGCSFEFWGTTAPAGYLLMQGQLVDISAFPDLFAVIGHVGNGGVDPGNGKFRIPDAQNKTVVGASATKALGTTGGAESASVVLTAPNLPPHGHDMAHNHNMTHGHMIRTQSSAGGGGTVVRGAAAGTTFVDIANPILEFTGNTGGASTSTTGNGPGTSDPINVPTVSPYVAANRIIKT